MTKEEIIQGLQFTIDMFLFDPINGETYTEPRNDMDKTTIDACKGAIELLEQQSVNDNDYKKGLKDGMLVFAKIMWIFSFGTFKEISDFLETLNNIEIEKDE